MITVCQHVLPHYYGHAMLLASAFLLHARIPNADIVQAVTGFSFNAVFFFSPPISFSCADLLAKDL